MDLNVAAAWAQGVTGKNVTTAIMDDGKFFLLACYFFAILHYILHFITGVDYMHPDIIHNYVSTLFYIIHFIKYFSVQLRNSKHDMHTIPASQFSKAGKRDS